MTDGHGGQLDALDDGETEAAAREHGREYEVGTLTLGVSIAVPEPYGSLLQEQRAGFGDPAAYCIPTHITLLPPTQAEASARPGIEAHLARVAATGRPFTLRLKGTDTFRPLSPVVFVNVAEGGDECTRLQERVRAAEGPLPRELLFPYHPHVTVAHRTSEEEMDAAYLGLAGFEASWTVSGFALYEQGEDEVWRLHRNFAFGAGVEDPSPPTLSALPRQVAHPSPACGGGASVAPLL